MQQRPLTSADQDQLWDWLHIALWNPPPGGLRPREHLQHAGVRIYAEDWGRAGDLGVVALAEDGETAIGACWLRRVTGGLGLAYVDDDTPQLGIALLPAYQQRGLGAQLLCGALAAAREAGYRQVSLTVHPLNPAQRLYLRCGFHQQGLRDTYHLMVCPL